jgi:hypothetical protein
MPQTLPHYVDFAALSSAKAAAPIEAVLDPQFDSVEFFAKIRECNRWCADEQQLPVEIEILILDLG